MAGRWAVGTSRPGGPPHRAAGTDLRAGRSSSSGVSRRGPSAGVFRRGRGAGRWGVRRRRARSASARASPRTRRPRPPGRTPRRSAPGEEPHGARVGARQLGRAQRDAPLAVAVGAEPPDGPGVPAAVHALDLADEVARDDGRRPADRRGRVQRGGEREARRPGRGAARRAGRARAAREDGRHVGREVHDVRQVQHERRVGDVHRRAERGERLRDRPDGVLVLLQVLRRPGELRGPQERLVVGQAAATDRAREHAGRHESLLAADEQLGGRADQPVDRERPARLVGRREAGEQPARVHGLARVGDDVAREHHLLQRARADALDALRDDGGPVVGAERAVVPGHLAGRAHGLARRAAQGVRGGGGQRAGGVDGREPRVPVTPPDDDARHDEDPAGPDRVVRVVARRGVVERERAERDGARAGQAHLVAHDRARERLVPRGLGVGEPARAPRLEPQRLAPADDPVAAAHPREGSRVGQEVDEGVETAGQVGDPGGPHDQRVGLCGGGRRFCAHRLPA